MLVNKQSRKIQLQVNPQNSGGQAAAPLIKILISPSANNQFPNIVELEIMQKQVEDDCDDGSFEQKVPNPLGSSEGVDGWIAEPEEQPPAWTTKSTTMPLPAIPTAGTPMSLAGSNTATSWLRSVE